MEPGADLGNYLEEPVYPDFELALHGHHGVGVVRVPGVGGLDDVVLEHLLAAFHCSNQNCGEKGDMTP